MKKSLPLCLAALLAPSIAMSQVIVNDNWLDADRFNTDSPDAPDELDADWWSSSNISGNSVEAEADSLGLISGGSGRGIHATFDPQTLEIGDKLVATFTFTTPATVGVDRSGGFKIALMDLNNAGLAADLSSSAVDPNPLYTSLPGYMLEFDVNLATAADDTGIRKHIVPNTSGRFLSTTTEWTSLGSSADADYSILANTEYVGVISLIRTGEDSMQIFGSLSQDGVRLDSYTATDASGIVNNIGMLGFWANSSTFGSNTSFADPDNGISFSNVTVELNPEVNILVGIDDSFVDGDRAQTEARDAAWWSSNSTGGNSIEAAPGELGLVTGTSGRGIHGTFTPQTLEIGETLVATLTFTTPATVGTNRGGGLKFALMEFNDPGLAADLLSSSQVGSENPLYMNLPGYLMDLDVNTGATADVAIREHNSPNTTGRFLGTSSEWTSMGGSGDAGYVFEANTEYVVVMSILRTSEDSVDVFGSLSKGAALLDSYSASDASGIPANIGMLGVWGNSNTFGSSNVVGEPDNGLTFTNVNVGVIQLPAEPVELGPEITSLIRDVAAGTVTIEWNAKIGTDYFVFASDDLISFEDEVADVNATTATESVTETGVTTDHRFYRVVEVVPAEE
ncbi:hypothetical protein OAG80_01435 [Akkermansiaceae bacterium]|nr:hypothetical protein [bacterium]MDB4615083.1 hypothetical protein [Akkermansiaceae bacterium]MDC0274800.1 hypothetical protein [Akkermansiaceae bacterium]